MKIEFKYTLNTCTLYMQNVPGHKFGCVQMPHMLNAAYHKLGCIQLHAQRVSSAIILSARRSQLVGGGVTVDVSQNIRVGHFSPV